MLEKSSRLVILLATTALSGTAAAQNATTELEELRVEALRTVSVLGAGVSRGDGGTAATSGGGGGPSGVAGYTARVSPSATKTNTPLIETPQSVSVVTREQLNDRNVQSLNEALAYTPGAATNISGYDPRFDSIKIRGFDITYNGIYRDGLRQVGSNMVTPRIEPYGLEAVTILRGPASGLYGLGSPGGILDATTKRPIFTRFGEVILQAGNYDRYQGNFDIGGPVEGSDGTMAYRLTGVARQANSFLPGAKDDRIHIAPAFTWKPSADTTFTFLSEYQATVLPGTAYFYNDPGFRVTKFYVGDRRFNDTVQQQYRIGYAFEHKFTPNLIFRQNFRHYGSFVDFKYASIDSFNDTRTLGYRSNGRLRESLRQYTLDNQLEGRFETGPIQHVAIAGLDYTQYDFGTRSGFLSSGPGTSPTDPNYIPPLNLISRNYGQQFIRSPILGETTRQQQSQLGLYVQDQMKFDRVILTLTGRHDWVSQDNLNAAGIRTSNRDGSAFTGRVGLSYLLAPGIAPYASYATTFTPQAGVSVVTKQPFRFATGDQIEAGVKYQIPGTNIQAAVAGFDIRQSSIVRTDPTNPVNTIESGEVSSRGFEMEMVANFGPGTNLTLAYTHLNYKFVNQTSYNPANGNYVSVNGNQLSGIPGDTITGFATYLFPPSSPLSGLTIGGGVRLSANGFADDFNTVRNPTVTLWDALVAYDFAAIDPKYRGFRAQINAYNILDRNYVNCESGYCYRGAPATVLGSLVYRW